MNNTLDILKRFEVFYYAPLLMFITEIVALIISILYKQKDLIVKLFISLLIFDIIIFLFDYWIFYHLPQKKLIDFVNKTNTLISILELGTYSYFFSKVFNERKISKSLVLVNFLYLTFCTVFLITKLKFISNNYYYMTFLLNSIEYVFIIPFCLLYYKKLINSPSKVNLPERPSFWLSTGILICSTSSICFYLLASLLIIQYNYYYFLFGAVLYFLPLTINFLFISKAMSLKKRLFE